MIPATNLRTVTSAGVTDTTSFGISTEDSAHIMTILRDTLYSDKVLAVLREYSANAWDEHRQCGKGDVPIKVTLPTSMDPTLTIRDYGRGLSHEDVFQVFTQYGKSTKRNTDSAVGMLGIGSKSGFAYSDTFTITSYHDGMKRVYAAVLDPSDKGELKLLASFQTNETGLQIQIPVKPRDIYEFQSKAAELYQYFDPRPYVNVQVPTRPESNKLKNGEIYDRETGSWVAIMGCIAYRINVDQLSGSDNFDGPMFSNIGGALYFNIGEVQINASREELKYSDATKALLVERFNALVDEYVKTTLEEINNGTNSPWEKRIKAQVLHRLSLPTPDDCQELFAKWVSISDPPKAFTMQRGSNVTNTITINTHTRLLLQDDKRAIKGFGLGEYDYVVKPFGKHTVEQARAELDQVLAAYNLTGVPVDKLSSLTWVQPTGRNRGKYANIKHRVRTFKLKSENTSFYKPYSTNWEAETEREASPDDVFVILHNFKASYYFYDNYQADRRIAKAFGIEMPVVYGYKHTEGKPVTEGTCVGIEYRAWRNKFFESLKTDANRALLDAYQWRGAVMGRYYGYGNYNNDLSKEKVELLMDKLGPDHSITRFAIRALEGHDTVVKSKLEDSVFNYFTTNVFSKANDKDEIKEELERIKDTYPMMSVGDHSLPSCWGLHKAVWLNYINMVDNFNKKEG